MKSLPGYHIFIIINIVGIYFVFIYIKMYYGVMNNFWPAQGFVDMLKWIMRITDLI